jgi:Ca-activated chloride channel homolog
MWHRLTIATALVLTPNLALTQSATFSSRVEAVRVDVLVTDGGGPVRGLGARDFEVLDNGVPQQIDLVSFDEIPMNVVLAFDMSDSIAGERRDRLVSGAAALLDALKNDDQAALITFNHVIGLGARLTSDFAAVQAALAKESGTGETSLIDGAYAGMVVGESDVGRALLIVFSDGVDTASWLLPEKVLETARRSAVVAYAVSVRSRVKPEFLEDLTSLTGGRLFEVERTQNLESVFLRVLDEFRHRYLVSYTPRGVSRDGWHRLDVRVKRRATVKARPGYLASGDR